MAAQPNFLVLGQSLANAAVEIALVPNVPPLAVQNQLNQIAQQLDQLVLQVGGIQGQLNNMQGDFNNMQGQFNNMQGQFNNMQQQLNHLQAGQDLLPIRLHNVTASFDAPLQYPFNIQVPAQAPQTKQHLLTLTGVNCQLVAQALNLPILPNNATVVQRRQQIIDYLGCAIIAH